MRCRAMIEDRQRTISTYLVTAFLQWPCRGVFSGYISGHSKPVWPSPGRGVPTVLPSSHPAPTASHHPRQSPGRNRPTKSVTQIPPHPLQLEWIAGP